MMDVYRNACLTNPEAEKTFPELGPEIREIMKSVGMENLLNFVDDTDILGYEIHLMSHPDTHAAYTRAY